MRISAGVFAAFFLVAQAAPAAAVQVYLTPDQGFPFQTGGDPREVDTIGPDFGEIVLGAGGGTFVGPYLAPGDPAQRLNLWVDPEGETLIYLGFRMSTVGGSTFTGWSVGATLGETSPRGAFAIQASGAVFTISNIDFNSGCSDFSGFPGTPPGAAQGNCVGSGPGAFILDGDPDQTAPMLLGTLTMDLSTGFVPSFSVVEIETGFLSSYFVAGQPEVFFSPQTMLGFGTQTVFPTPTPEPSASFLLGVVLAALATARTRCALPAERTARLRRRVDGPKRH